MTNIIYNGFLRKFFNHEIDLLEENTYKLCLFKSDYTPRISETLSYDSLALSGLECVEENDIYSDNPRKGYKPGGKYVKFTQVENESEAQQYSCGDVEWEFVNLSQPDNLISYAIIYRESDGLLICCFPFEVPVSVGGDEDLVGDTLQLSWKDVITLSIDATNSISIDAEFSKESGNALQNKTLTDRIQKVYVGIEKYGIRLNDEPPDYDDWSDDSKVDKLNKMDNDYIDSLFD